MKPQRPAFSWRISFKPADTCSRRSTTHVLEQVAQARFDGALVLRLHLEEVGEGAHLADLAVGVDQDHARGIGEAGAVRVDLFERVQARGHRGHLVFARTDVAGAPFVFDAGARQLRLARRARDLGGIETVLGAAQGVGGHLPLGPRLLELGGQFAASSSRRPEVAMARSRWAPAFRARR